MFNDFEIALAALADAETDYNNSPEVGARVKASLSRMITLMSSARDVADRERARKLVVELRRTAELYE